MKTMLQKQGMRDMMLSLLVGIFLLGSPVGMAGAAAESELPSSHPTASLAAADWINLFGVRVLSALLEVSPEPNGVISPLSLATALTMTAQGAAGVTAAEFARVLGYGSAGDAAEALAGVNRRLMRSGDAMTLQQANGLWLAPDMTLQDAFAARQQDLFGARVARVDFEQPDALQTINDWFAEHTAGMLPRVLDRLPADTRIVLGNALYMKGRWLTPFDPQHSRPAPFYLANGTTQTVTMMAYDKVTLLYRKSPQAQSVRLPFADPDYELVVILPNPDIAAAELLIPPPAGGLPEAFQFTGYRPLPGHLALPRLNVQSGGDITELLMGLGLFQSQDFSQLAAEPLVFNQVVHRTALILNEEGAEAAAATAVVGVRSTRQPETFEMVVNRPFLMALNYVPEELIVFAGLIGAP